MSVEVPFSILVTLGLSTFVGCQSVPKTVRVSDSNGNPVANEQVSVSYTAIYLWGRPKNCDVTTDANGRALIDVVYPDSATVSLGGSCFSYSKINENQGNPFEVCKNGPNAGQSTGLFIELVDP